MTDAQLSVLLYQYAMRLTSLLDAAEAELPDEAKPVMSRPTTGLDKMAALVNGRPAPEPTQTWRTCPLLEDLRAFTQELKHDSEMLELASRRDAEAKK